MQLFYVQNCKASSSTNNVTATVSSSTANVLLIAEINGIAWSSALGSELAANGSGTALDSGALTLTSNDLLIGFGYCSGGTPSTGTNFSSITNSSNCLLEYYLCPLTSAGALATATTGNWTMLAAGFHNAPFTYGDPVISQSYAVYPTGFVTGGEASPSNYGWAN